MSITASPIRLSLPSPQPCLPLPPRVHGAWAHTGLHAHRHPKHAHTRTHRLAHTQARTHRHHMRAHTGLHAHRHPMHAHTCTHRLAHTQARAHRHHMHAHTGLHAHTELTAHLIQKQKQLILSFELSSQHGNDPLPGLNSQEDWAISAKDGGEEGGCRGKPALLLANKRSGAGEGRPRGAHQPTSDQQRGFCEEGSHGSPPWAWWPGLWGP